LLDEDMATPHTARGPIDELFGDLGEDDEEEYRDDGSTRLQDVLFESLGIVHSRRGGAGTSGEVEASDDAEE
ncbi:hypothetical protein HAX54_025666, partial [Datura stramonium]|nr:hypothetical protein [Datura stramonium]